ncbi:MAG TPA: hypothetical protein VEI94_13840 [Candidatus Bathyarchaeia archaeon]|nr:hypothetical protein [Candidatus Bathyarchaeia archaeon]
MAEARARSITGRSALSVRSGRSSRGPSATRALGIAATAVLVVGLAAAPALAAPLRRDPKPTPTPDLTADRIAALSGEIQQTQTALESARGEIANLGSRLDSLAAQIAEVKGIVEPMREEVRGLYVESSNVRGEIARLDQSSSAYTEALGKSRYVLTLLLVATAVLQLIVLAVLMRSR